MRGVGLVLLTNLIYLGLAAVCLSPALITLLVTGEPEIAGVAALICAIPAIIVSMYATFRMYLGPTFLIDYDLGVLESLRQSDRFMRGNKLTVFLIAIVVGFCSLMFMLVTCCIGILAVIPYTMAVVMPTIYLLATGQAISGASSAKK
jgi:hypothetical protein